MKHGTKGCPPCRLGRQAPRHEGDSGPGFTTVSITQGFHPLLLRQAKCISDLLAGALNPSPRDGAPEFVFPIQGFPASPARFAGAPARRARRASPSYGQGFKPFDLSPTCTGSVQQPYGASHAQAQVIY